MPPFTQPRIAYERTTGSSLRDRPLGLPRSLSQSLFLSLEQSVSAAVFQTAKDSCSQAGPSWLSGCKVKERMCKKSSKFKSQPTAFKQLQPTSTHEFIRPGAGTGQEPFSFQEVLSRSPSRPLPRARGKHRFPGNGQSTRGKHVAVFIPLLRGSSIIRRKKNKALLTALRNKIQHPALIFSNLKNFFRRKTRKKKKAAGLFTSIFLFKDAFRPMSPYALKWAKDFQNSKCCCFHPLIRTFHRIKSTGLPVGGRAELES